MLVASPAAPAPCSHGVQRTSASSGRGMKTRSVIYFPSLRCLLAAAVKTEGMRCNQGAAEATSCSGHEVPDIEELCTDAGAYGRPFEDLGVVRGQSRLMKEFSRVVRRCRTSCLLLEYYSGYLELRAMARHGHGSSKDELDTRECHSFSVSLVLLITSYVIDDGPPTY